MSMLFYLIKAWIIGFAIAAPVGPIGMLCIKKALESGIKCALLVGIGAALADAIYGLIAALGLTAISSLMLDHHDLFKLFGGIFLLYLAYKEYKGVNKSAATVDNKGGVRLVIEVFFLTLTNPMTILSFLGIFASIGSESISAIESVAIVVGIFLGSMTWWYTLGLIVTTIKHKLHKIWLERIRLISCFILASFGLIAIAVSI